MNIDILTTSSSREFVNGIVADKQMIFENLVTKKQLAECLELSQSFISKLMVDDGLPYFKLGRAVRFRVSEIVAWLQKRRMP